MPLEKFDYHNEVMGCVLRKSMENVDFEGITVSNIVSKTRVHRFNAFRVTLCSTATEVELITMTTYCSSIEY